MSSYVCHHQLTSKAQEDLLWLLQLHVPRENLLPSSLYAFCKMSGLSDTTSLEPIVHTYCQTCYTVLSDYTVTCPNQCCSTSCPQSTQTFITLSVGEQLKVLLECKSSENGSVNTQLICLPMHIQVSSFYLWYFLM